tara:strand:- start:29 stop:700 length:672 start_codon:yes stop_codon:yes gene_type:complete
MDKLSNIFNAVIPAREFDEILINKNILPFGNSNLLEHKIKQLQKVDAIDNIYVSTDSDIYKDIALSNSAIVLERPQEFSGKGAVFNKFVKHISTLLPQGNILWTPVTTPLVDENDYTSAIQKYQEFFGKPYDSLITVNKVKRYILDENGPLNFRADILKRNQSSLPDLYEYVNGINIAPCDSLKKWEYNWGHTPYKLTLPRNKQVDICSLEDYELAKYLFSNQ